MSDHVEIKKKKRKRADRRLNKISFDEESVPKDALKEIIHSNEESDFTAVHPIPHSNTKQTHRNQLEHLKEKNNFSNNSLNSQSKSIQKLKKKSQKIKSDTKVDASEDQEHTESNSVNNSTGKKEESKRAKKRKRYEKLIFDKRLKSDQELRDKCLNYLSKWKHSRSEWKFEKLRQVWLQHNMFNSDKIPEEFWEVLLEYFNSSKGKVRQLILESALKIIDTTDQAQEKSDESEVQQKVNTTQLERARSAVQCLQD